MKISELAKWVNHPPVTIRAWTVDYQEFLSPTARPGGRARRFSDIDARVIAAIAAMKSDGRNRDEITASLKSWQGQEWRGLPDMPAAPADVEPISVIPREAADERLESIRRQYLTEIAAKQETIETLQAQLTTEQARNTELSNNLAQAKQDLGRLEGELSRLETERPPVLFVVRLVVLVIMAVVVVFAVLLAVLLLRP